MQSLNSHNSEVKVMKDSASRDMLSWDESVFRDEQLFEVDHMPEKFVHRENQMNTFTFALRPAIRKSRPLSVYAQGPPGTGKTTAVKFLFDELEFYPKIKTVQINCQVDSTRYSVFSRLFESVFSYEPPSSGISFKKLFRQVTERIVEDDETLIVALDDVNYLFYEKEASDTLYSLLRAHEVQQGARIGVIIISSDPALEAMSRLDARVQSVFRPEEVYFPPYGFAEILDILGTRVKRGFYEGVVSEKVLNYAAKLTAEKGDLRVGIDLLRRAGLNAEMRASREMIIEDIDKAYESAKYVHLSRGIRNLTDSERGLLHVLVGYSGERAGDVYDVFHEQTGLGYTRYSEIVNKLEEVGIITAVYKPIEGRGRSREIELLYKPDAVKVYLDRYSVKS